MKLSHLLSYLDELLFIPRLRDYCENGLQIEGRPELRRVALGVSVTGAFISAATIWGADALLTHHGLFWNKDPHALRGVRRDRVKAILAADLSLIAYHLPLDLHPVLGNNAQLAAAIGLAELSVWNDREGQAAGLVGTLPEPLSLTQLCDDVASACGGPVQRFGHGEEPLRRVAVCTGGAASYLELAAATGAQVFLTGEPHEGSFALAQELGVHMIAAGHYRTETFGVKALGLELTARWGLETRFFAEPNPV